MKRISIRKLISIVLVTLSLSHGEIAIAQNNDAIDLDQLKVAFIFNFSKYFSWPEDGKWREIETFNICINEPKVGNSYFNALAGQTSQSKKINIISLTRASIDIGQSCHIWFIDQARFVQSQAELDALGTSDVLTVSDYPGFLSSGGIMEFVRVGNRMKFKINPQAAQEKRLTVSSFLMTLALTSD